jgi:nicotinamide-nucleotide amidase
VEVCLSAATPLDALVERLAAALRARAAMLATAESCTGGLVAAACTSLAGSSEWFERGVVTYSNAAKSELLGVDPALITQHGAVSEERAPAAFAVAVTGIAGPGGGSIDKPVGTVWIATAARGGDGEAALLRATGDRAAIRHESLVRALEQVLARVEAMPLARR